MGRSFFFTLYISILLLFPSIHYDCRLVSQCGVQISFYASCITLHDAHLCTVQVLTVSTLVSLRADRFKRTACLPQTAPGEDSAAAQSPTDRTISSSRLKKNPNPSQTMLRPGLFPPPFSLCLASLTVNTLTWIMAERDQRG